MSAIQSLLRVMTLRDAEAIVMEAGKVPSLRRRGAVEALAMPALEAQLLADFAAPLLGDKQVDDGVPISVPFSDGEARFQVTIEKVAAGLRLVVRRGKPLAPPPKPPGFGGIVAPPPPAPETHAPPMSHAAPPAPGVITRLEPARAIVGSGESRGALTQLLWPFVTTARERGASDVLLSTGQTPRLRIDGKLDTYDHPFEDADLLGLVHAIGSNQDLSLEVAGTRVRVNCFDHLGGAAIAVRLIRDRVPALADLDLPPEVGNVVDHRDGLVLVCGPTGSGKSTTLAALIDLLDQRRAAHVITLEDPIEYRFTPRRCIIHQRELGIHVPSFAVGLRAALREAPDVILLGELRDRETISAALTAAETGHLVLATLHAPNATGAIDRMIDAFPEGAQRQIRWQLASVLRTVITQYLLPRRDGGRAAAVELVPVTPAVANIMRKGDLHTLPTAIQSGREAGMIPLERSLARLIDGGSVSRDAVRKIAADHDLLAALSGKLR